MGSLVGLWRTRLSPSMLGESEWIERARWLYLSYSLVHMSLDPTTLLAAMCPADIRAPASDGIYTEFFKAALL